MEAWYPGAAGGTAIARVLFGDVDPGGRLPATFPRRAATCPTAGDPRRYPGVNGVVALQRGRAGGLPLVRRPPDPPAFPFGFGLSYTRFGYGRLAAARREGRRRAGVASR